MASLAKKRWSYGFPRRPPGRSLRRMGCTVWQYYAVSLRSAGHRQAPLLLCGDRVGYIRRSITFLLIFRVLAEILIEETYLVVHYIEKIVKTPASAPWFLGCETYLCWSVHLRLAAPNWTQ